jgi:hypothetical protein
VIFDESVFSGGAVDLDGISVPEPSTFLMLASGLSGLVWLGRPRPHRPAPKA